MGQVRMSMRLRESILNNFKKQYINNNPDPFKGATELNHVIIEGLRNSPVKRFMDELTNHPFLKHYNLSDSDLLFYDGTKTQVPASPIRRLLRQFPVDDTSSNKQYVQNIALKECDSTPLSEEAQSIISKYDPIVNEELSKLDQVKATSRAPAKRVMLVTPEEYHFDINFDYTEDGIYYLKDKKFQAEVLLDTPINIAFCQNSYTTETAHSFSNKSQSKAYFDAHYFYLNTTNFASEDLQKIMSLAVEAEYKSILRVIKYNQMKPTLSKLLDSCNSLRQFLKAMPTGEIYVDKEHILKLHEKTTSTRATPVDIDTSKFDQMNLTNSLLNNNGD